MKYQIGHIGRVVVAKFEDGEDVLENLNRIVINESIKAAAFYLLGGLREGKIVVGPENEELPPVPVWKELGESHEILGFGTIFYQNNKPKIHLHGTFGKGNTVKAGCLREKSETYLIIEAVILELSGINAIRELDPVIGQSLLKFQ